MEHSFLWSWNVSNRLGSSRYVFPLAEWTESGGEKTFVYYSAIFSGIGVGLLVSAIVPAVVAGAIGYAILGLRGHYFAICTLGLGIAAGEIAGGIEIIGAGQGFTTPPFSAEIIDTEARGKFSTFEFCVINWNICFY